LIVAAGLCAQRIAFAQPATPPVPDAASAAQFDARVEHAIAAPLMQAVADKRNSAAVLIYVRQGTVRLARAAGLEDVTHRVPVSTSQSRFGIASISKTFIGVALAQLKSSGKIASYDDPANRYLRTYKLPDSAGHAITLRQLATHTAGLDESVFGRSASVLEPGEATGADYADRQPPYFRPPGEITAYSGFGTDILGLVVTDAGGMPYSKFIETTLLRPLGMADTVVGYAPGGVIPHEVRAFEPESMRDTPRPLYDTPESYPSGGIFATGDDMARYMLALLESSPGQGPITDGMREDMFTVQHEDAQLGAGHGLVFELVRIGSRRLVYHNGFGTDLGCQLALSPVDHAGVFFCLAYTPPVAGLPPDLQPLMPFQVQRRIFETFASEAVVVDVAPHESPTRLAWQPAWNAYLGDYVSTGRHHFGIGRLRSLMHPPQMVHVVHGRAGLEIDGIDGLIPRSPGVFQTPGLPEYFTFYTDARTGLVTLSRSTEANAMYERPRARENPRLMMLLLALVIGTAASGLLWPLWPTSDRARAAGLAAPALACCMLGLILAFMAHPFGDRYLLGIGWPVLIIRILGFGVLPVVLVLAASTAAAWRPRGARVATLPRLHLLLLTLVAAFGVVLLAQVGVIGFLTR
jgi:CubicO group peptidase (beta-lactamase class C family)